MLNNYICLLFKSTIQASKINIKQKISEAYLVTPLILENSFIGSMIARRQPALTQEADVNRYGVAFEADLPTT